MKANKVGKELKENTIPEQKCKVCGRPTKAPYGRTSGGEFLCSRLCCGAWEHQQRQELLRYAPKEPVENERRAATLRPEPSAT